MLLKKTKIFLKNCYVTLMKSYNEFLLTQVFKMKKKYEKFFEIVFLDIAYIL